MLQGHGSNTETGGFIEGLYFNAQHSQPLPDFALRMLAKFSLSSRNWRILSEEFPIPREKESTDFENQTSLDNFMKDFSN